MSACSQSSASSWCVCERSCDIGRCIQLGSGQGGSVGDVARRVPGEACRSSNHVGGGAGLSDGIVASICTTQGDSGDLHRLAICDGGVRKSTRGTGCHQCRKVAIFNAHNRRVGRHDCGISGVIENLEISGDSSDCHGLSCDVG